jgi:hypothetical protein
MNTNPSTSHLTPHKWERGKASPNPSGRPKSLKNMLKLEYDLTPSQTNEAILSLLMHTKSQMQSISHDDTQPMFTRIIAKAILKSYDMGNLYALESLLNRTQGMPKQQTELKTTQEHPIFVTLDLEGNTQPLNIDIQEN